MTGCNSQDAEVVVGVRMAGLLGENGAVEPLRLGQIPCLMMADCLL
jgi:hypothetical protein